jgi:hypothetical protein
MTPANDRHGSKNHQTKMTLRVKWVSTGVMPPQYGCRIMINPISHKWPSQKRPVFLQGAGSLRKNKCAVAHLFDFD